MQLPYDPATACLGIYPREMNTYANAKTCSQKFIVASFVMDENWKQLKMSFSGRKIKQTMARTHHGILLRDKKAGLIYIQQLG